MVGGGGGGGGGNIRYCGETLTDAAVDESFKVDSDVEVRDVVLDEEATVVYRISRLMSKRQLARFHPRARIDFLFVLKRPNDKSHTILMSENIFPFLTLHPSPF